VAALLGLLNLILIIFRNKNNEARINLTLKELVNIIDIAIIIGLIMITLGSFLGGVWANESWGRYWGWDPKETWALVTVLVYTFISHMHKIPGFKGIFAMSAAALVGFSSVLMTYFGVNYYLSGLHSYAQGEPAPIPAGVYIAVVVVFILLITAYFTDNKYKLISGKKE
jgi:ABC-type transport system involved in cytochrome c biogenesis permease subunit